MSVSLSAIRQSAAEVLAYSISTLFPGALFLENEVTESGFFYDVHVHQPMSDAIIPLIEERMRACIKEAHTIVCMEMMRENAMAYFAHLKQPYKVELLQENPYNVVNVCKIGGFSDLCTTNPTKNTEDAEAFRILKIEPLSIYLPESQQVSVMRIHGTAFANKMDLKRFLKKNELGKKLDHRLLGEEMKLFFQDEAISPGFLFWQPKGKLLRQLLQNWWQQFHSFPLFQAVSTPKFADCFSTKSFYGKDPEKESFLFPEFDIDGKTLAPVQNKALMHALTFKKNHYSLSDLPVRYTEWDEELHQVKYPSLRGLFRSRSQLKDYTTIFCSASDVHKELISSLQFIDKTIKIFGFEHQWILSSKVKMIHGTQSSWNQGQALLINALKTCSIEYNLDQVDSSYYGPRVEVRLMDAIGREWSGPSLGINVSFPEKLTIQYKGEQDTLHIPTMIIRTLFGALESFIGVLIEKSAGMLPLWLAPEQVRVVSVSEKSMDEAQRIYTACIQTGIRAGLNLNGGSLGAKVHQTELEKIPYLVIVGDREQKQGTITVRPAGKEAKKMDLNTFLSQLVEEGKENTFAFDADTN